MGDSEEFLIWSPTSPAEGEELCKALDPGSAAGCDGVVPRVVKGVAQKLSGSLSHLFNCCTQESHYPACFKVGRVVPVFKGKGEYQTEYTAQSQCCQSSLSSLTGC